MEKEFADYEKCILCPRACGVSRNKGETGVCGVASELKLARAALHFWEEPCISGTKGYGTVFFSGCSMHCVFCQNQEIAQGLSGKSITRERLLDIFFQLKEQGAVNINLVTPTHYLPHIIWALEKAKTSGLALPVVYNTSGYEKVESIKRLEGLVDVYLPDYKFSAEALAREYARASDYPQVAFDAIREMVRQQPVVEFRREAGQMLMKKGVMVRHLLLPGELYGAKQILAALYDAFGNQIYYSIMSQYTPMPQVAHHAKLGRKVAKEAYENLVEYAMRLGITNGFIQSGEVAMESFIPHFDNEGV